MRKHLSKPKYIPLMVVAIGLLFLFAPKVNLAIEWLWETVTVPQEYITNPATFRDVIMLQGPTGAYTGWIVGEPHGSANTVTTLLQYANNKWNDAHTLIAPANTIITLTDIDGLYYNGEFRLFAAGKKKIAGVESGVVYYYSGTGWFEQTPAANLPPFNAISVALNANGTPADSSDDNLILFVGGDDDGSRNNIWRFTTNHGGGFGSGSSGWAREDSNSLGAGNGLVDITALSSISFADTVYTFGAAKTGTTTRMYRHFNTAWNQEASLNNTDINDIEAVVGRNTANSSVYYVRGVGALNGAGAITRRTSAGGAVWNTEVLPGSPSLPPLHGVTGVYDTTLKEFDFWAVGNTDTDGSAVTTNDTGNAAVLFTFHNGDTNGTWVRQDSRTGTKNLMGIDAASRIKVTGVGSSNALIMNSPGNIFGWGWFGSNSGGTNNDSIGWVSLNCVDRNICEASNFSYGINIAPTGFDAGQISGYAWIGDGDVNQYREGDCQAGLCQTDNSKACVTDYDCRCSQNPAVCKSTGWISFNKTDTGTPPAGPYNNGSQGYISFYDQSSRQVSGWARILAFAPGGTGWLKLRGNAVAPPAGTYSLCGDCADGSGSLANGTGTCAICDQAPGSLNYSCRSCTGCNGNTETCTACGACNQYGVSVNESSGKVSGFAWSQDYGWLDFTHANYYSTAWIQTRFGDLYSRADIGSGTTPAAPGLSQSNPNANLCNATYVIQARGTITNFCSDASTFTKPIQDPLRSGTGADNFNFPDKSTQYTSALGTIDVANITTVATGTELFNGPCSPGDCNLQVGKNKFGDTLFRYTGQSSGKYYLGGYAVSGGSAVNPIIIPCQSGSQAVTLNNVVYYVDGDLIINSAPSSCPKFTLKNGVGVSGAGMFVAKGKIIIDKQVEYETTGFNQLNELASAFFMSTESCIVFSENASSVVGSYYAAGTCNWPEDTTKSAGIHIVNTVTETPFTLHGLMIAKSFNLGRTYRGTVLNPQPAEKIFYDGRLIINPPRALQDFSLGFPSLRQISP